MRGSRRGVVYVATGAAHVAAAAASAASVRRSNPGLSIALFSDREAPAGVFDEALPIVDPHARSKVDRLAETPFSDTLYLDTDTRVLGDLADLFRLLERFDLAAAHVARGHFRSYRRQFRHDVPDAFPQLNTGVILYSARPAVLAALAAWREAYGAAGFKADQVSFRDTIWASGLRLAVLPPQYNLRRYTWIDRWLSRQASPVILHTNRFHPIKQTGFRRAVGRLAGPGG